MANEMNPKSREDFATGQINWLTDTFKAVLVSATYVKAAAHAFLSDVPAPDRVATSAALTGKSVPDGWCKAANLTVPAVSGAPITQLWVYRDSGSAATSRLIAYFDRDATTTLLSYATNGGDVLVTWNSLGIFRV